MKVYHLCLLIVFSTSSLLGGQEVLNLEDRLYEAAADGDREECTRLIEDVSFDIDIGTKALFIAASKGHLGACQILVKLGDFVDPVYVKQDNGDLYMLGPSPLKVAAYKGHEEICQLLIGQGADTWRVLGKNWLEILKELPPPGICRLLIQHGINLENIDSIYDLIRRPAVFTMIYTNAVHLPSPNPDLKSSSRIQTALLCLRKAAPQLSKDIHYLILTSIPELKQDFVNYLVGLLRNGKRLHKHRVSFMADELAQETLNQLEPYEVLKIVRERYIADAEETDIPIIDESSLEEIFESNSSNSLRNNIFLRLQSGKRIVSNFERAPKARKIINAPDCSAYDRNFWLVFIVLPASCGALIGTYLATTYRNWSKKESKKPNLERSFLSKILTKHPAECEFVIIIGCYSLCQLISFKILEDYYTAPRGLVHWN